MTFEPGKVCELAIVALDKRGALLDAGGEKALLPQREIPEGAAVGDRCTVFTYLDGEVLVATLNPPQAQVGELALLKVVDVNPVGAFLDWGLPKQLLVPYAEQETRMQQGRSYLVRLYLDEKRRVTGSSRIDRFLEPGQSGYRGGEEVALTVWRFTQLGAVVIVDNRCEGLLYRDEVNHTLRAGDRLQGRIARVRDDGKLDVTLRQPPGVERDAAQEDLLDKLRQEDGFLPLHDKSSPEEISRALGMSKKLFKKAVGGLLKRQCIVLEGDGIRLRVEANEPQE